MVELHLVVFYLNNELYGVESSQVKQIIKYQEGNKIPDMPNYVEGILSLRGRDITVINLNMKFGYAQSEITK
jgi:purine-binding chemotaxis protein CheW